MASCLGIYLNNDIVKFAKMSIDASKKLKLEQSGTRFIKGNTIEVLNGIIDETNSKDIPIAINPQLDSFYEFQMQEQARKDVYIDDTLRIEFEAWCEKNSKVANDYSYVHYVSDLKSQDNRFNANLNIIAKSNLDAIYKIGTRPVSAIYPPQFLINKLVPSDEENYILVNLDTRLSVTTVINKKVLETKVYDIGIKDLLEKFFSRLGSYAKAYETFKQINVYGESSSIEDPVLNSVTEQILQDILKTVLVSVNKNRSQIQKVLITGTGVIFTNIDILFTEFLDVKSEVLKPEFVNNANIRDLPEVLVTTQAMALASAYLRGDSEEQNYIKVNSSKVSLKEMFKFSKRPSRIDPLRVEKEEKKEILAGIDFTKVYKIANCACIVAGVTLIGYIIFSNVYAYSVTNVVKNMQEAEKKLEEQTKLIEADNKYIETNLAKYKAVNDDVQEIVEQIESNKIGKFSTYNVATFMQQIIKIIPKEVRLESITSDDNKNVKITAVADSYANLGYFVAQLKLEGILNNVTVNKVTNGSTVTIEIGGELP